MDAKIIIENLLSAIESGDKDDIKETVDLAKLMLPGLSAPPATPDLTGKWAVLNFDQATIVGTFDTESDADQAANAVAQQTGEDLQVYEIKISAKIVPQQQVTLPQPGPAQAPALALCPDCGTQEDANGDCPNQSCSRNAYMPPGYVKSEGKHRPGSGLANRSLYSGGSGSNDTGVLR